MKENSLSGDDVKTPPPLTPKDSLIVGWMDPNGELIPFTIKERIEALEKENIELRNERDELKGLLKSSLVVAQQEAEAAQEENKKLRGALERILADAPYPSGHVFNIARAALADGKEGGR